MKKDNRGKQLTISIFLIASLINIVSFFSFKESIRQEETKKFKEELKHYTKHKVQDTKLIIDNMVDKLEETKILIEKYSNFEENTIIKILKIANKLNHFNFTSFAFSDGNGFDNAKHRFNISDRNYFQRSMAGEVGISGVISSKVENKKPVQIISVPIYNKDKKVEGVLFGVFDFQTIEKLTNTKLDKVGRNRTYILTQEGKYVTKPEKFEFQGNFWDYLNSSKISKKEIQKMKINFSNKKEGEFSYTYKNITYYGYYEHVEDINCYLISEIGDESINNYMKSISKLAVKDEVFTIICFAVMLLCVFLYFKKVNKEIKEVNEKLDKNMDIMYKAAEHSEKLIFTYDNELNEISVKTRKLNPLFRNKIIPSASERLISYGVVAPESIENLKRLFTDINSDFDVEKLAERLMENLRKSLEKVYSQDGKEVKISSSIGFTIAPDDGISFETLYKKADKALYHVKKNGKNNFARYRE